MSNDLLRAAMGCQGKIITASTKQYYELSWWFERCTDHSCVTRYFFSVSISVYNKWMFAGGQLDFHFPLFITVSTVVSQWSIGVVDADIISSSRATCMYTIPAHPCRVFGDNGTLADADSTPRLVQFGLASLVLFLVPSLRPRHDSLDPPPTPRSIGRHTATEHSRDSSKPLMPLSFYLTRIAPCAGATGLDIGLGNTSLRYVTLIFFSTKTTSSLVCIS